MPVVVAVVRGPAAGRVSAHGSPVSAAGSRLRFLLWILRHKYYVAARTPAPARPSVSSKPRGMPMCPFPNASAGWPPPHVRAMLAQVRLIEAVHSPLLLLLGLRPARRKSVVSLVVGKAPHCTLIYLLRRRHVRRSTQNDAHKHVFFRSLPRGSQPFTSNPGLPPRLGIVDRGCVRPKLLIQECVEPLTYSFSSLCASVLGRSGSAARFDRFLVPLFLSQLSEL